MVLPVSQSLLVQSVSAWCLDYVPGVSSYVSLYKSVLPHVTGGLLLMSVCKPVWMSLPVFLCLLRLSFIKYPVCHNPRLLVPGSRVQHRDRIIHPKENNGVRRRCSRPYPAGSHIRGVRRGILRARFDDGAPRRGNPPSVSARGKLPALYGSPRHHRIVLERGDLPVSGKLPVPSRNETNPRSWIPVCSTVT